MKMTSIEARDLPDAWFQCLSTLIDTGRIYLIKRGSYAGQRRLEFDFLTLHIKYPGVRPLIPDIPAQYGIPAPVAEDYIDEYLPYLMTDKRKDGEEYTYGERLHAQIEEVVSIYTEDGHDTNQACMEVGLPQDIFSREPPCLRLIDTRISYGRLHFVVYFRSWDLWGGLPANLAAIQMMKEYMAERIGVEDGEIVAVSKGVHLYDYVWPLAECRTSKNIIIE